MRIRIYRDYKFETDDINIYDIDAMPDEVFNDSYDKTFYREFFDDI